MTPKVLAGTALRYGRSHQAILSDDICFSMAFAKIAIWLNAQDEVSDRTVHKMREAMDILVHDWNLPYSHTEEVSK
jgi:hypothetical protein